MNISNIHWYNTYIYQVHAPLYVSYVWNFYETIVSINDSSISFLRTKK